MAFPDDWESVKNPESAIISTVNPIFLVDNAAILVGPGTLAKIIPASQPYTLYAVGSFNASTVRIRWSLDNITFHSFLFIFDNANMQFTAGGYALIPRIAAGVYVQAIVTAGPGTNLVTIVLQ